MAIKLADVLLYLGATDDKLKADLRSAEGLTTGWGKAVSGRMDDVFRGAFERVGQMATNLVVNGARAAAGLVVDSVNAAGDLGESINKVNVVFDTSADTIQRWSEGASTALGQSRQQALEAVGTFGNLFDSMGIGSETTAEMSTSLVELASDLASFNNIDPGIALEKLRAGVVGEVEPLRTLGVNLTAVAVEAKALQMGIVETDVDMTKLNGATIKLEKANADASKALKEHGAESIQYREAAQKVAEAEAQIETIMKGKKPVLDAAQKAQAAYALIFEQTANAQGDFARTSEGAANAQRVLDAQMVDLKATIGEAFLPAWTELLAAMNTMLKDAMPGIAEFVKGTLGPAILELIGTVKEWVTWFMQLDPATQGLIGKIAGFVAILVPLLGILVPVIGAVSGLVGIFTAIIPVIGTVGGAMAILLNPITLIVAAVIGLTVAWSQNWFGIQDITNTVTTAIGATLSQWWSDFKLGASTALDNVKGFWEQHSDDVQTVADTHWATMGLLWTTQWDLLKGVGTAGVQFLTGDWEGGMTTLKETASGFWENTKALFKTQLDQVKNLFTLFGWGELGEQIVTGIANGIAGAGTFIYDALKNSINTAMTNVQGWLGIQSPSRRAADEIGTPLGEGIMKGASNYIDQSAIDLASSILGIMPDVKQALSSESLDVMSSLLGMGNNNPGDTIAQSAIDTMGSLLGMGGRNNPGRSIAQSAIDTMGSLLGMGDNNPGSSIAQSAIDTMNSLLGINGSSIAQSQIDTMSSLLGIGSPNGNPGSSIAQSAIDTMSSLLGMGQGASPSLSGAGNFNITINNTFNGPADETIVKKGTESGIVSAMRSLGLR